MKKSISTSSASNKRLYSLLAEQNDFLGEVYDADLLNQLSIDLYNLRVQCGYTQKELAEKIGVKQSNISRWEQPGYQGYKLKQVSKLIRTMGGMLKIAVLPNPSDYVFTVGYAGDFSAEDKVLGIKHRSESYMKPRWVVDLKESKNSLNADSNNTELLHA